MKQLITTIIIGIMTMASNLHSQHNHYEKAYNKLSELQQTHLLEHWDSLSPSQKEKLLKEIELLDTETLHIQQKVLGLNGYANNFIVNPFQQVTDWTEGAFYDEGLQVLQQGKVGVVIVAGGQGTRFGYEGPKGCFPTSQVKKKSLFQLFAEKVLYAGKMAGVDLPLAIMTSSNNHDATIEFFADHNYFGLQPSQVSFFQQADLPFVNTNGNMFLESFDTIAKGPNGNGAFFEHFVSSGIWDQWKNRGVDTVSFVLIDNPLGDPLDLELLGCHQTQNNEVTIKCISRVDPFEKVGVIVADEQQRVHVLEYSEIDENERTAKDPQGELLHRCANISLFCFDMGFVKTVAQNCDDFLPYHIAFKAAKYLNEKGESVRSKEPIAKKFERFIFDMLPYSSKVSALMYPRESCFAPLKNPSGKNSPETVRKALQEQDRKQWKHIAGTQPPSHDFELSQEFFYPTASFIKLWRGVSAPNFSYIE